MAELLFEQIHCTWWQLSMRRASAAQIAAAEHALGVSLPREANTTTGDASRWACWLGPGRWLIGHAERGVALPALEHGLVVEESDARVVWRLSGPGVDDWLARGCPLDTAALLPGRCASSLCEHVPIFLHRRHQALELHLDSSYGDSICRGPAASSTSCLEPPAAAVQNPPHMRST